VKDERVAVESKTAGWKFCSPRQQIPQSLFHYLFAGSTGTIEPRLQPIHADGVRHLRLAHSHSQPCCWTKCRFGESAAAEFGHGEHSGFEQTRRRDLDGCVMPSVSVNETVHGRAVGTIPIVGEEQAK
jgi:hypothetical protein